MSFFCRNIRRQETHKMTKSWPWLLLLAATAGCGTIAGYQASPRWKIVVTDADGKPRPGCGVALDWKYYFGINGEHGGQQKTTDERGEVVFEPVVLRPNVGRVWRGRISGALVVHSSSGPNASVSVSKLGFERMQAIHPYDTHRENGTVVSRFVMMPPNVPAEMFSAIQSGDVSALREALRAQPYYATNDVRGADLLQWVVRSPGAQGAIGVEMVRLIAGFWRSAHPTKSVSRLVIAQLWAKEWGNAPMDSAVSAARRDLVEALLSAGATPDTPHSYFYPDLPLIHRAIQVGDLEMVKLLVRYKVNVNQLRKGGQTPLDLAEQEGKTEIVALLRAAGAKRSKL